MMRFSDFKIATKILALQGLLALVSLGAIVFATSAMYSIDDTYGSLTLALTNSIIQNTYIAALSGLLVVLLLAMVIARATISSPIKGISDVLEQLAEGEFDAEIVGADRKDEIGDIARAALVFRDQGREAQRLRGEQEQTKAKAERDRKQMMQKLAADFEANVQKIIATTASSATELYKTAEAMQRIVSDVSEKSGIAGASSQQTSSNVGNVSAAVEEMSAAVREIADQVSKSTALTNAAATRAKAADKTTLVLAEAAAQIGGILELIQGVAGKINLLALNATIESARAGEAGRGFAVVASEVKSLAGQTTKATEEIAKQIASVQKASEEVVEVLKSIQDDINNVTQYASGIASAVEEQSSVNNEISANMHQASQGVQDVASNVSAISQSAAEADQSARQVLGAAEDLSKQSEQLNQQVALFLNEIRAG